ncbi:MAG: lipase chaperone [bacterium]|nr:lipase chaperone [bacterium]
MPATAPTAAVPTPAVLPTGRTPTGLSGRLRVDADGRFVADPDALAWLRSFLLAHRHLDLGNPDGGGLEGEAFDAALRDALQSSLPATAWAGALDLARRFLAFRAAARKELSDPALAASGDLERRLQWLRELRRRSFGAELAERLFGEEEATLRVQLAMRRVHQDASLDPAARQRELDALEEQLPQSVRETRARTTAPLRLAQEEAALRDAGAGDAEIRTLREARVGPAAAERLAALDEERRTWHLRLDAYRTEREELLSEGMDADGLRGLRTRHFAEHERLRVERLEASWRAQRAPDRNRLSDEPF